MTSTYAVLPMNATSIAPPMPMIAFGRPLANVVISPVCGSTREILPAAPSVTYSAPPGPIVLPVAPCRPVTSRVALGPPELRHLREGMRLASLIDHGKGRPLVDSQGVRLEVPARIGGS